MHTLCIIYILIYMLLFSDGFWILKYNIITPIYTYIQGFLECIYIYTECQRRITTNIIQIIHELETEGKFSNSLHKINITLITSPDKVKTKKEN